MTRRSLILGSGAYLPERILTNGELAERIDTSDAWIVERTGIRERRIAGEGEKTSDLAVHAADALGFATAIGVAYDMLRHGFNDTLAGELSRLDPPPENPAPPPDVELEKSSRVRARRRPDDAQVADPR